MHDALIFCYWWPYICNILHHLREAFIFIKKANISIIFLTCDVKYVFTELHKHCVFVVHVFTGQLHVTFTLAFMFEQSLFCLQQKKKKIGTHNVGNAVLILLNE